MKIIVTGTHFTPAQAVIAELKKNSEVEIIYIGRKTTQEGDKTLSVESQVLPKLGVKFTPLIAGRFQKYFSIYIFWNLIKIPIGFLQSFYLILKEQPDLTLSFGGYVGLPVVFSSWLLSVPIIIHEQTLVTGLANKISALFANKIAVSFDKKYGFDQSKVVLTGNPIRSVILEGIPGKSKLLEGRDKLPVIYITGGNQGSIFLNNKIGEILAELTQMAVIVHQSGDYKKREHEKMIIIKNNLKNPDRYIVQKWFSEDQVSEIYRKAELVVSRAGINTMLELAYFGIPAIVIPLPNIYKNEQGVNAKFFNQLGLCEVLNQSSVSGSELLKKVKSILTKLSFYKERAKKTKSVLIPDASKRLSLEVLQLLNSKDD